MTWNNGFKERSLAELTANPAVQGTLRDKTSRSVPDLER